MAAVVLVYGLTPNQDERRVRGYEGGRVSTLLQHLALIGRGELRERRRRRREEQISLYQGGRRLRNVLVIRIYLLLHILLMKK